MISMMAPREHFNADGTVARQRLSSAGRPAPLVQVGDDGRRRRACCRAARRGEIVIRGSLVMTGYYKDPEATAEARRHGWHHTGDIGYIDDDGYLYIVDRAKDMIITGGFNVYSVEVEQALMQHPDVQDSAVIGLPDDKWGEQVVAVRAAARRPRARPDEIDRVREGAHRQRQGAQARRDLARPAALEGRQGAEEGHPRRAAEARNRKARDEQGLRRRRRHDPVRQARRERAVPRDGGGGRPARAGRRRHRIRRAAAGLRRLRLRRLHQRPEGAVRVGHDRHPGLQRQQQLLDRIRPPCSWPARRSRAALPIACSRSVSSR